MLIACPNCTTPYQVDASSIGARGRSVRCHRCRSVWFALPPGDAPATPTPEPASDEVVTAFRSELGPAPAAPPPSVADAPPIVPGPEQPAADDPVKPAAPSGAQAAPHNDVAQVDHTPVDNAQPDNARVDNPQDAGTEPAHLALADIPIPLADAPPLAPGTEQGAPPIERPAIENGSHDIETVARRRRTKADARQRGKSKVRLPLVIMMLAAVCAALVGWRKDVVRQIPQLASFYAAIGLPINLRGLAFVDVKVGRETHDGVPVLLVEGTIVNTVATAVEVPRLRFALRNEAGAEVYAWTAVPAQTVLEPGASLPFRTRLASPPDDGYDVQVRFFTRRDVVVGLH